MESSSIQLVNGNIKKIKSKVILKKILSHLYINRKLDLIIYNKQFQNKLEFNIEDYKNISKKYKIVRNGIIKEYFLNTDFLIFEGDCIGGKKSGKGKEYYLNGNVKFEGDFLNGKKVSGIGYDIKGNLAFKLNKNSAYDYFNNGILKFSGEYYNGKDGNGIVL